jgi:hypothetical protein
MTQKGVLVSVVGKGNATVRAPHDRLTSSALQITREASSIVENEGLFAAVQGFFESGEEFRRDVS